jgi:hypothetical protein
MTAHWLIVITALFLYQPQAAPQRDAAPVLLASGTSVIGGHVLSPGDPPTPVRRAIVTLTSVDTGAARSVVTTDEGAFAFDGLAAGRYTVVVTKPAFLTTAWGAPRPGRQGTTIVLADGQRQEDLRVTLPRGSVLAGQLTTSSGDPIPDTEVRAIPARHATVGGTVLDAETFRTDAMGRFRIYGLAPGQYLLGAYPVVGRGDIDLLSATEYDAVVAAQSRVNPGAAPRPTQLATFAPTYYPGTALVAQATPITVSLGEERAGLDMSLTLVRTATIRGAVVGTDGQPAPASQITVDPVGPPGPIAATTTLLGVRPDAQGRFTIRGVPPGTYRISVRSGGITIRADGFSSNSTLNTLWAYSEVTTNGEDVDGLTLQLRTGAVFGGRFIAEGAPDDVEWARARVTMQAPRPVGITTRPLGLAVASRNAPSSADGTFTVDGLAQGEYELTVSLPPQLSGWQLVGLMRQGRDLRDAPLLLGDLSYTDVEVVLSRTPASLAGRFSTESGGAAPDYFLVVFPDDRALWHHASPRLQVTRPAANGQFRFANVPPGTYRLAAVDDLEDDEHRTTAFLASLYDSAIRITIVSGQATTQDVRVR